MEPEVLAAVPSRCCRDAGSLLWREAAAAAVNEVRFPARTGEVMGLVKREPALGGARLGEPWLAGSIFAVWLLQVELTRRCLWLGQRWWGR